jgi:uncharacterized protein (DUF58 family)
MTSDLISKIDAIELAAKQVVEGYLAGRHRSPRFGFAVEFAQHREYAPGDDIKHLDWKVFGRTERYHLKQYEQETNLVAWLIVDASGSMRYGSTGRTKYDAAAALAAGLSHLIVRQTDAVGFARVGAAVESLLKPSAAASQTKDVARQLAAGPTDSAGSAMGVVAELAGRLGRRGIVFLISDLLDNVPDLLNAIRRLRFQKHEVVVLHVVDPAELEFPFRHPTEFRGLETGGKLPTDPLSIRDSYLKGLNEHLTAIEAGCRESESDYVRVRTDEDLGATLAAYLRRRAG